MLSASPSSLSVSDTPHDTSSQSVPVNIASETTQSVSETGTDEPDTLPFEVPQTLEQDEGDQDR